jgi:hypothetical protein
MWERPRADHWLAQTWTDGSCRMVLASHESDRCENPAMTSLEDDEDAGTLALRYLTKEDHRLLDEQAQQARYVRGDVILAEGARRQAIFLLRKGLCPR